MAHMEPWKKPAIISKVDAELYGYIKVDSSYDTARTSVGNLARWVESEGTRGHDDQFNLTANQTRLGLRFKCPKPSKDWTFNLGTSFEDPSEGDLSDGMREFRRSCFGNVVHAINDCASVGVELSHRRTDYKAAEGGDSFRVQTSFIFRF